MLACDPRMKSGTPGTEFHCRSRGIEETRPESASCDDGDVTGPIPRAARSHDVLPLTVECWIGSTGQVTVSRDTRLSVLGKVRQGQNAVLSATVM